MARFHRWVKFVESNSELVMGVQWARRWHCSHCGTECVALLKPKSKKDYLRAGVGRDCDSEAVRSIMES